MTGATTVDARWCVAHPLPLHGEGTDKNSRGRVLAVGGAETVPGALLLTGEAALRAGAGKLRMATVASAAIALGVAMPEAATRALPADEEGEIAASACEILAGDLSRCDTLVLGPGMTGGDQTRLLVEGLLALPRKGLSIILDAAAIGSASALREAIRAHEGRVILTPHFGEMAALSGRSEAEVAAAPAQLALAIARDFGAVIVLKNSRTVIAAPDGALLDYHSDCVGLATGGSGDVLAGIIGGLVARGAAPLIAAAWGVWLHGEAGRRAERSSGPIGFLARELLPELPGLMASPAS